MAFIGESRRDNSAAWNEYLCLNHEECKCVRNILMKRLVDAEDRLEFYQGLHDAGTISERQENFLTKWEDEVELLSNIINKINIYNLKQ